MTKKMIIQYALTSLIVLFGMPHLLCAKEETKFEGHVSSGFKYKEKALYGQSYFNGKFKVKTTLNETVKAVLDFYGRSETGEVELNKAYVRLRYSPWFNVKVGQVKKRFTSEEMVSSEDLHTIEPSIVNRHMKPFGFVVCGNGVTVYRKFRDEGFPVGYRAGIYYNESRHMYGLIRLDWYRSGIFDRLGIGGIYRQFTGTGQRPVAAFSVDCTRSFGPVTLLAEGVLGEDPVESHYRYLEGREDKAYFWGGRMLLIFKHPVNTPYLKIVEPVVQLGFVAPDDTHKNVHRIQCLAGINVYVEKHVRVRVNYDLLLSNNMLDTHTYDRTGSKLIAEVQTRW